MVVADGQGIPLACSTASASPAKVKLVEGALIQVPRPEDRCIPLIADRAYDSDPLRERLKQSQWDLICPHRKGRKRAPTQDSRKLRLYRRRWTLYENRLPYSLPEVGCVRVGCEGEPRINDCLSTSATRMLIDPLCVFA